MEPENDRKTDQVQKAYRQLRKLLFHNEIVPGQKLSYRDLADRLGMSQTPIIQALKWMEYQNLVLHEPNRGYFTAPISLKEVAEIYDFRELIEVSLLPDAERAADRDGLARLKAALDAHQAVARAPYLHDRLLKDVDFHLALASLTGCQVRLQTLRHLFDLLYLKYSGTLLFSTSIDAADLDHQALYDRVAAGDRSGAKKVLVRHIRRVKSHVLESLEKLEKAKRNSVV